MAFFKATYTFRTAKAGWTETFYDVADSIDLYPDVMSAEERNAVLSWRAAGITLLGRKVTEEGGLRRSKLIANNSGSPASNGHPDTPGVTVKCRLNFSGGGGRVLNIRGIADDDLIRVPTLNNEYPVTTTKLTNGILSAYASFITKTGDSYHGKVLKPITEAGYEWKNVVSFEADPDNDEWTKVNVSTLASPVAEGTLIYFKGIDKLQLPYITGVYRTVGATTVSNFSIPTRYREPIAKTSVTKVQWRPAAYDYPAITGMSILKIGTRDTAGPFGAGRGARRKVKYR